jgi:hypothetical protein
MEWKRKSFEVFCKGKKELRNGIIKYFLDYNLQIKELNNKKYDYTLQKIITIFAKHY